MKMKISLLLLLFILVSCASTNSISSGENNIMNDEEDFSSFSESMADVSEESSEQKNSVKYQIPEVQYGVLSIKKEEYDSQTAEMSDEQKKFYTIKKTRDYKVVGEDLDYIVLVDDDAKAVIIQFEESDSDEDWKNNYLFLPWPLKLDKKVVWTTHGYAKVYKSSKNIHFEEFYNALLEHPGYKVVIRGWSFGSAMAKITARHFIIRSRGKVKIDELTTFGDVKCWYNPFYSSKKYCRRIREYVTPNDLITWCVPIYHRDVKCKVGDKYSRKRSKNSEHYHTHYEEYDYSEWE